MGVLVTGANGFVGRNLVSILNDRGYKVRSVIRDEKNKVQVAGSCFVQDLTAPEIDFDDLLGGIDTIVHLAALTKIPMICNLKSKKIFYNTNVEATARLGLAAAKKGVRRFIYISTIKVNGEATGGVGKKQVFRADDPLLPEDIYGVSKLEAEKVLLSIAIETGLEVVIIRPPMIYGVGVGGNFSKLVRLTTSGIPLPFGALHNERSLVSIGNLVDLVATCISHPAAANNIFLVSDGRDVSTTDLLQIFAKTLGISLMLFPVAPFFLDLVFSLPGLRKAGQRLCGSLKVDIKKTCELLSWQPPFSFEEEIHKTVMSYRT